ncbi:GGDEF domain-containing protein [Actinoplanes utahensis]|uniref:GGDEF domain-containing protein n=1 Tax=Actinoplanes utahensis TaxID=1869 RepID=A0A0A6XFH6_ACTUT|nr:GGDEF domain-containing protein [Actinoplanes utahensis]KHD78827.1 hypothetical protein MB27_01520 [Actinoplanes utahensis]GIF28240.1 hypothetical protein Aut01nite_12260 [Actinoplanes utahensis]
MPKRSGITDPVLLGFVALGVLLVPWFLRHGDQRNASWVIQTGIDAANVWFTWQIARNPLMTAAGRRFWQAAVVGCAACLVGDGYQTALVLADPTTTTISGVQTALVVTGMTIVVAAMLRHPLGGEGRQRLRLWFDAATVLTGVAVFLWYFVLAGDLGGRQAADRWGAAATAVVMLLITFGLLKLILSGTAPFTRAAGISAALGVAGTAFAAPITSGLIGDPSDGAMIVVQLVPCVLASASFRLQQLQVWRLAEEQPNIGGRSSRLPYLAVITTQILLVVSLRDGRVDLRVWGVAIGAVVITALVLGRQVAALRDNERLVVEARALHDELSRQATHDALTGLANRVLLQRRLAASTEPVGMLLIDLDGFKEINDQHGHHTGDLVLQEVATRLTGLLGAGELAARLGGDEFAVLLPGAGTESAGRLAEQVAAVVAEPMPIDGRVLRVGASVGVSAGTPGAGDTLLRAADAAMYERKRERRARRNIVSQRS